MINKPPFLVTMIPTDGIEKEYRKFFNIDSAPSDPDQRRVIQEISQLPVRGCQQVVMVEGHALNKKNMDKLENFATRRTGESDTCFFMAPAEDVKTGKTDVISFFVPSSTVLNGMQAKGIITRDGLNKLKKNLIGSAFIN